MSNTRPSQDSTGKANSIKLRLSRIQPCIRLRFVGPGLGSYAGYEIGRLFLLPFIPVLAFWVGYEGVST